MSSNETEDHKQTLEARYFDADKLAVVLKNIFGVDKFTLRVGSRKHCQNDSDVCR